MKFSIYGINFYNKGAELMMHAAMQQVKEWDNNNIIAAQLNIGDFDKRKKTGLNHLAWGSTRTNKTRKGTLAYYLSDFIPKGIRTKYNITLAREIDVILDASGFAFSDQWGHAKTERMAQLCSIWKKQGKKTILLPQAFGPFNNEKVRTAFIKLIDNIDLAFARDYKSYEYISQLNVPLDRIKVAPDFTNLLEPEEPDYIDELRGRPCIVPNQRMIDKTSQQESQAYFSFLEKSLEYLDVKQLNPFILIHELNDVKIGNSLQEKLGSRFQVVQDDNPLYLKGILNNCSFMIGSRFHSLISALSQGTPAIGTGWSHKYQMLFKDYDCSGMLVSAIDASSNKYLEKLDMLIDEQTRSSLVEKLTTASNSQKQLTKNMWQEVKTVTEL